MTVARAAPRLLIVFAAQLRPGGSPMFGFFPKPLPSVSARFILEQLEERIVFDAAVTPLEPAPDPTSHEATTAGGPTADAGHASGDTAQASHDPCMPVSDTSAAPLTVVLVSSSVMDAHALAQEAGDSAVVIGYDSETATPKTIAQKLLDAVGAAGRPADALAVLDHGASGLMKLGSEWLSEDSLADYGDALSLIASAVSEHGQILLYGCDVAAGAQGEKFTAALASQLGRAVFASVDDTGGAKGDWDLEYSSAGDAVPRWSLPAAATRLFTVSMDGSSWSGSYDAPIKITLPGDPSDHWFWITDLPDNGALYETETDALNKIHAIALGPDGRFRLADPEIWFMSDVASTYDTHFDYKSVKVLLDEDFSGPDRSQLGEITIGQNYNHNHWYWGPPPAITHWWIDPGAADHTGLLASSITGGIYTTNHLFFDEMPSETNYDVHLEARMDSGGNFGVYYYAAETSAAGRADLWYTKVENPIMGFYFGITAAHNYTTAPVGKEAYPTLRLMWFDSGGTYPAPESAAILAEVNVSDVPGLGWPTTSPPGQNNGGGDGAFDTWHQIDVSVRENGSGGIHHSITVDGVSVFEVDTAAIYANGRVAVNNWTWNGIPWGWLWTGDPPKNWTPGLTYYDEILVTKPAGSGPMDIHVNGPTPPEPPTPPTPPDFNDEPAWKPLTPEGLPSPDGYGALVFTTWDMKVEEGPVSKESSSGFPTPAARWPSFSSVTEESAPMPEDIGQVPAHGAKSPEAPITGLPDFAEKTALGYALVFNFDEHVFMDLCTDQIVFGLGDQQPATGLYGWVEEVKTGKALVFNMSEINAVDFLTMPFAF
jgi:hypothetical protein